MVKNETPAARETVRCKNAVVLSYVGDAVHTLYVREKLCAASDAHAHVLHERAVGYCNAGAQARAYERIEPLLSEEERGVYLRGRNCKNSSSAKNAGIVDYRKATGFEALVGFLYLSGQNERLARLLEESWEDGHAD